MPTRCTEDGHLPEHVEEVSVQPEAWLQRRARSPRRATQRKRLRVLPEGQSDRARAARPGFRCSCSHPLEAVLCHFMDASISFMSAIGGCPPVRDALARDLPLEKRQKSVRETRAPRGTVRGNQARVATPSAAILADQVMDVLLGADIDAACRPRPRQHTGRHAGNPPAQEHFLLIPARTATRSSCRFSGTDCRAGSRSGVEQPTFLRPPDPAECAVRATAASGPKFLEDRCAQAG